MAERNEATNQKTSTELFPDDGKRSRVMRSNIRRKPAPHQRDEDEFDQRMIDLARVTRVMAGGKRMRFRACMVVGDRKGRVGWGIAKGADVAMAMQKAIVQAKKNLITVSIVEGTIPHEARVKFKAARVLIKPAKSGSGLIAGGAVRTVLDLAGISNIVSKMYGSNNKINNVAATFKALQSLRRTDVQKNPALVAPALIEEAKKSVHNNDKPFGKNKRLNKK